MTAVVRLVRTWSAPPRLTWLLLGVAAAAVLVEGYYGVFWRKNDYSVHVVYGRFFLDGEPYRTSGATAYYPLARLWLNASLASFEYYTGRALCYAAAVLSLGLTFRIWSKLARPAVPLPDEKQTAAIGWTVAVLLPYLIRDLDECGLQLLLLFFLSAAGYAFAHGRKAQSGFWLGLAIVYKATPLLFLPLLVWKREWRTAGWAVAFTVALSLLPATYLGWDETVAAQRFWFGRAGDILKNQQAYPSVPGIEPPKTQNVSLKALVARYLETHPPGHPLRVDHPLFVQFGSLSPEAAAKTVTAVILLLGAGIAWRMRRRWGRPIDDPNFAAEWAVACLFVALMSPLCWRQHLVMAIPCAYLVARERLGPGAAGGWRKRLPVAAACVILLTRREVIGQELAHLLLTYKLDTLAVLSYALLGLTLPRPAANHDALSEPALPRLAAA
ncbi:MAG TPA: glycosyltransferase family 87 protein [Planctomycetaceae bacterium]